MRWDIKICCYAFYKSRRKPFHTTVNKRQRVTWAKSQISWTPLHWEGLLWTDESNLQASYGNAGRKVFRKRNEAKDRSYCCNRVFSNPRSVWGSIAAKGVDNLHFYRNTVKVENYLHILSMNLRQSGQWLFSRKRYLFQQDNAWPHTAKLTQIWLR